MSRVVELWGTCRKCKGSVSFEALLNDNTIELLPQADIVQLNGHVIHKPNPINDAPECGGLLAIYPIYPIGLSKEISDVSTSTLSREQETDSCSYIKYRSKKKRMKRRKLVAKLRERRVLIKEIALRFRVSKHTINRDIRALGLNRSWVRRNTTTPP